MKLKSIWGILLASVTLGQAVERVYIACGKSGLRVAEFDGEAGTLSLPREAISLSGTGFLAVHPDQPLLYATCSLDGSSPSGGVAALKMTAEGTLELVNQVATKGEGTCHLSLDGTSKVLFAANYGSGSVATFQVLGDFSLSEAVSAIQHEGSSVNPQRQTGPHAHYFAVGPQNQFAYAPDLGLDKVLIYRFDPATAQLTAAGAGLLEAGAGPRHMKFSQDGKFAHVLNELSLSVTTFSYSKKDGSLKELATVSVMPEGTDGADMSCAEIKVHPNGRFVYTSQRDLRTRGAKQRKGLGRNSISVFRVTGEGLLQRTQTISAGVRIPRNFNFDPSGKWILAGGQASNDIQIFSVNGESGKLSPHGEVIDCPGPICFEWVPQGE